MPHILDEVDIDKANKQSTPLQFPVLFIRGEKSDYINDSDMTGIKKFFPNAMLVTIFDAGHWVHAEQPDLFLKSIHYFLEQ